ncbi:hypothetical protein C7B69_21650 [filamentous cyanobacterium Phorm 46]|nr:hypothetical protein C7B69_21650 [filamentous cyanobacterium Phorm 46]PSB52003.1 hypothetical protein C7B67_08695 [filamentous cyanobacterium Phorm 6]
MEKAANFAVSAYGLVAGQTCPPLAVHKPFRQLPIVPKVSARELLTKTQVNLCASTQSFRDSDTNGFKEDTLAACREI